jgi:hypothetical protein
MAKRIVCAIQQPIAIRILKTLGRYALTGEGATKQLKGVTPPLILCARRTTASFSEITPITSRSNASSTARMLTAERLKATANLPS